VYVFRCNQTLEFLDVQGETAIRVRSLDMLFESFDDEHGVLQVLVQDLVIAAQLVDRLLVLLECKDVGRT
jgi:hypothetical protein